MEHTNETKEAQMGETKRIRIEFTGGGPAVNKAIQALYTAVQEAAGSVRAANWKEYDVYEGEDA